MSNTIPHLLTKQAYLSPNKEAITVHNGQSLTFLQLKEKSESFARKLATLNIESQQHIALLSTNCLDMVIAIHALSYLNKVVVLLNTRLTPAELNYQIENANVDLLITNNHDHQAKLNVKQLVTYEDIYDQEECETTQLATEIKLTDPFTMMYTSGTTGHPKGVIHTYGNHWWSAIGSALNLGLHKDDKWLATLPLFHVGGLSILMRSVIYGMSVYLFEKYDRKAIHHVLMEKNITIASLVTVMLRDLIDELGDDYYPDSLRCLLLGGGSIPEAVLRQVKEKKLPVFQSYGMTETSSQIVTLSAEDALNKLGSSGKPLFPAQLQIIDKNSEGIGEIVVKGLMVINGYYNNEAANNKSFKKGWLKTGDLGRLDEDGFLYVVDRRSDLIISGGENIYPSEIENCLLKINGIKEAAVIGKKDDKWGEVPVAFIVTDGSDLTNDLIVQQLKQLLATYKIPQQIFHVEQLPKTASNKIRRHQLAARLKEM